MAVSGFKPHAAVDIDGSETWGAELVMADFSLYPQ